MLQRTNSARRKRFLARRQTVRTKIETMVVCQSRGGDIERLQDWAGEAVVHDMSVRRNSNRRIGGNDALKIDHQRLTGSQPSYAAYDDALGTLVQERDRESAAQKDIAAKIGNLLVGIDESG